MLNANLTSHNVAVFIHLNNILFSLYIKYDISKCRYFYYFLSEVCQFCLILPNYFVNKLNRMIMREAIFISLVISKVKHLVFHTLLVVGPIHTLCILVS